MKSRAWFFRIGEFSLINDAVADGLRAEFPELRWEFVDVECDVVGRRAGLKARATVEAIVRYGSRIAANRQPPRDFFPRLPIVLDAVRRWVERHVDAADTALVFQTQSLFDARHPGCPHFLYTDHTYLANRRYPEPKPLLPVAPAWAEMEKNLYGRANCNFVSSGFAAQSLAEDYAIPAERIECVFSGGNVFPAENKSPARSGRVILFVGVDWERKGGPELVEAFRAARVRVPEAELWIVGCSPDVRGEGVRVLGRLTPERVAECYQAADIFCLPSRMDPSASVLGEAAAQGLPVVATRVGGNAERVIDGGTGFLCEPGELSERLTRLLLDPEMRRIFGAAGRRLAEERFTWAAVCQKMARRMRREIQVP